MRQEGIVRHDAEGAVSILAHAPQNSINIQLLLGYVMDEWGGLEKFAKDIHGTYKELPPKSPARERLVTNIMRLISAATLPGTGPLPTDQQELEEDLRQEMRRIYPDGD